MARKKRTVETKVHALRVIRIVLQINLLIESMRVIDCLEPLLGLWRLGIFQSCVSWLMTLWLMTDGRRIPEVRLSQSSGKKGDFFRIAAGTSQQ